MRKNSRIFSLILLALGSSTLWAEGIYKWTDANGRVHFGDRPPEQAVTETVTVEPSNFYAADSAKLPDFESVNVVLYSAEWCGYCRQARAHFESNGIPFLEYDIETDAKGRRDYKRLNGKSVPIILVNDTRLNGFSASSFDRVYATARQ